MNPVSTGKASPDRFGPDRFGRHHTTHLGVVYRIKADGTRTYYAYGRGRFIRVDGGEDEALERRAALRGTPLNCFSGVAEEWLASKHRLRRSSRERYRSSLDLWVFPKFGHLDLVQITADGVAELIREMEAAGASSSSILNHLKPLNGTFKFAMRKGLIGRNPVALLTADERRRAGQREMRVLEPGEIAALLAASESLARRKHAHYDYSLLLRTAVFSGLRLGELLGLQWKDVDFSASVLQVCRQVTPRGEIIAPKTRRARRRVVVAPDLATQLENHRHIGDVKRNGEPNSFVFASNTGTALSSRNVVNRGFRPAAQLARLDQPGRPRLRFHDLRHCYASMMVAQGLSSTDVAAQLGHSNAGITERIYIHQFNSYHTYERLRKAAQDAMTST
jgi:integrase